MLLGLWLLVGIGSDGKSNVKRFIRHPQLAGFMIWAAAHLLSNGALRSVVLFGGLGGWAITSMFAINRREGTWQRPAAVALRHEVRGVGIGLVSYALLFMAHPYLSGVRLTWPWY